MLYQEFLSDSLCASTESGKFVSGLPESENEVGISCKKRESEWLRSERSSTAILARRARALLYSRV